VIPVLVFDIETIPDVAGLRALHGHPASMADADVAAAAFAARRDKTGSDFLPHHVHRIAAISCVFRDTRGVPLRLPRGLRDAWPRSRR